MTSTTLTGLDHAKIEAGFMPEATIDDVEGAIADALAKVERYRALADRIRQPQAVNDPKPGDMFIVIAVDDGFAVHDDKMNRTESMVYPSLSIAETERKRWERTLKREMAAEQRWERAHS